MQTRVWMFTPVSIAKGTRVVNFNFHLPATVKTDPCFFPAVIKNNIKRSHVCLKGDSGSYLLGTKGIVYSILIINGELAAHSKIAIVWDIIDLPGSKAIWIAIIASLSSVDLAIHINMKVHLFAGVILMNVLTVAFHLVNGIFYGVYAPSIWMLSQSDGIPQPPT